MGYRGLEIQAITFASANAPTQETFPGEEDPASPDPRYSHHLCPNASSQLSPEHPRRPQGGGHHG